MIRFLLTDSPLSTELCLSFARKILALMDKCSSLRSVAERTAQLGVFKGPLQSRNIEFDHLHQRRHHGFGFCRVFGLHKLGQNRWHNLPRHAELVFEPLFHLDKSIICYHYKRNNKTNIILFSVFTKSGLQLGSKAVVEYPVCDVTPP